MKIICGSDEEWALTGPELHVIKTSDSNATAIYPV